MLGSKVKQKEAVEALMSAMKEGNQEKIQDAWTQFHESIVESVRRDFETANGDSRILAQRGFRQLTAEEKSYYETLIQAGKSKNPMQTYDGLLDDKVMPATIIEDVYRDLVKDHQLLGEINFQSVSYLTRWILNDHPEQAATWGAVNSEIATKIKSAFRTVEITQCKLSAYALIEKDMLDLGPVFLDNYIRTFLKEAIAAALETAIVTGNGKNQPIGLDRDIHHGVTVSDGVYPKKTAVKLNSFMPKDYGPVISKLTKTEVWYTQDSSGAVTAAGTAANSDGSPKAGYTKHGGKERKFSEVMLICNLKDYLEKVMPATTVLNTGSGFVKNVFPFPTKVVTSGAVESGEAILCLPKEYFLGIGTSKDGTLEYTDDRFFLEDQRAFKSKMHAMGLAFDDTVSVLLDISDLSEMYVYAKTAGDDITA